MEISVEHGQIGLDGKFVATNEVYLSLKTTNRILRIWVLRVEKLKNNETCFLPYSIDDEFVDAFQATRKSNKITLTCCKLDAIGFDYGVDDAQEVMTSKLPFVKEFPLPFGTFTIDDFLGSLKNYNLRIATT